MRIVAFSVKNYKGFSDSDSATGTLSRGINVIVGQNNAGKTALLEALTLRAGNVQHRSPRTHPIPGAFVNLSPSVTIDVAIARTEWLGIVADRGGNFVVRAPDGDHQQALHFLDRAIQDECFVRITRNSGLGGEIVGYPGEGADTYFAVNRPKLELVPSAGTDKRPLGNLLALAVQERMYLFSAERFNVGEGAVGNQSKLRSDAANLPEVLSLLQPNPVAYRNFNALVSRVLPQVRWISVQPIEENRLRILVWMIDPELKRPDLAVPLNQSGTGVGQVLAILYATVVSTEPQIIAIDEPQSFLHPGAVRALLEILREHSHHQFLVTTHSPVVVTAARADSLLYVRLDEGVSSVSQLRSEEANDLKLLLVDLGVRMEDVFGYDNILWVEGPTEEVCFPIIVEATHQSPACSNRNTWSCRNR